MRGPVEISCSKSYFWGWPRQPAEEAQPLTASWLGKPQALQWETQIFMRSLRTRKEHEMDCSCGLLVWSRA